MSDKDEWKPDCTGWPWVDIEQRKIFFSNMRMRGYIFMFSRC